MGQWESVPFWGVRNIFNGVSIEMKCLKMSAEESRAFIERVARLLNDDAITKRTPCACNDPINAQHRLMCAFHEHEYRMRIRESDTR